MSAGAWSRPALLALVLAASSAHARADPAVPPTVDGVDGAARRAAAARCERPACRSIVLIDRAVRLQIAGVAATVGRPRPIPRDRDARVAVAYRKLVKQAREVAPELCRQGASLVSGYDVAGGSSEVVVPVAALDLASRLDADGAGPGCARTVIRAMPATPAADAAIRNAHALCAAQGGAGRCAVIAR